MKKIYIYTLIAAFLVIVGLSYTVSKISRERAVYKANQTALLADVEYYRTENGKNAASVQKLTLSYSELKDSYDDMAKVAEDLGVKLKRAQSVSATNTVTELRVKTVVRDSVVYREGRLDSLMAFRWRDAWTDVIGEIRGDSVEMGIASTDTLYQIVHRVPHKFWFIKWGTKAIRQEVTTANPHTKITYSKYIEIK